MKPKLSETRQKFLPNRHLFGWFWLRIELAMLVAKLLTDAVKPNLELVAEFIDHGVGVSLDDQHVYSRS